MSELSSTAASEAPSLKLVDEVRREGLVREVKHSEMPSVLENANGRIVEHIRNGLLPEHIEKRLDADLQQPEVQRQLIGEFSPYSEQITPHIRTTQELSVYTRNGLQEAKILDRPCLQLKIDPTRTDAMGRSNIERTAAGRPAIDENGDPVNLHHIGQKEDSPLAELPDRVHKECDGVLHEKSRPTEVHGEGNNWNEERFQYWSERATTL
jgi:hypothetical protein